MRRDDSPAELQQPLQMQSPVGQLAISQVAPSAQSISQPPPVQSPMAQVAPGPHSMVQLPPGQRRRSHRESPVQVIAQSPPVHVPMRHTESAQSRVQSLPQASIPQLPLEQLVWQEPWLQLRVEQVLPFSQVTEQPAQQSSTVQRPVAPLQLWLQPPEVQLSS